MRRNLIYIILAVLGMLFSCQRPELDEQKPIGSEDGVSGEATISFSALLPSSPETKAMGDDPTTDIQSMHLVIFDGNGMLVETREATIGSSQNHDGHAFETTFEVTLSITDQPRIIHFIANCPVGQIAYGHEASIIGNMYVSKDNDPSTPETSYWARVEVPYILVTETYEGSGKYRPEDNILPKFQCVPMLRNYAQVTVIDSDKTTEFEFLGFTLYNTIDLGTIAPYNNTTQQFQSFVNPETGQRYKYPALTDLRYQGHALSAADLNTSLEMDSSTDDGYKWYAPGSSFYMYERKISVKTDDEEMWKESPPHLIIKGRYNGKINYYKVDLVYNVYGDATNEDKPTDIVYYNILRNFRYQFTISEVAGEGYDNVPDAVNGATSNNLSGSATTSKFTNISDEVGRIWVSYTDTTLVSNNQITLRYKYVPNLNDIDITNNDLVENGGPIILENLLGGEIIKSAVVAENDITDGPWAGFREVTIQVNDPQDMTKEQTVIVRTDNANLTRNVRYYLKKKYRLEVDCDEKVSAVIGAPMQVDIKLPVGLTDDMFPLELAIEVEKTSLSPNAEENTMPVVIGESIIPSKKGKKSFYFTKTIETKEEYDAIPATGTQKTVETFWLTNMADNESTVYVYNKYFDVASDNFINAKAFSNLVVNPSQIYYGTGRTASISFTMDPTDADYTTRNVTVELNGLQDADGNTTLTVKPTQRTVTINNLVTNTEDGNISFSVEDANYARATSVEATRRGFSFSNLTLPNRILQGAGRHVNISFSMDANDNDYASREVEVSLNGLETATGESVIIVTPTPGSRTVEINDLRTTSTNSTVSFTVNADGYENGNSPAANRRQGTFTPLSFSVDGEEVTNIPTTAGQEVYFNFNLSDYDPGMTINVDVVGLDWAGESRARYSYTPTAAGAQSIRLTSTAGAKTCSVSLSADYFASASANLKQSDLITGIIPKNRTIAGTLNGVEDSPNSQSNCTATITIDGNENITANCNVTRNRIGSTYTWTYTITINSARDVTYTPGQKANIRLRFRNNTNNYYIGSCDVQDLIDGNITNLVLTKE